MTMCSACIEAALVSVALQISACPRRCLLFHVFIKSIGFFAVFG